MIGTRRVGENSARNSKIRRKEKGVSHAAENHCERYQ